MADDISDEEAAWRDLIAHYGDPAAADDVSSPWPAQEDLPEHPAAAEPAQAPTGPPPTDGSSPVPGVFPTPPQFRVIRPAAPAPPPEDEADPDDEGHYIPPEPPPLPHLDPVTKGAWAAVFGGPGYLLVAVTLGWPVPGWAGLAAVAAFIGGFATLVVRMGDRPPTDSGPDDGAVV